MSFRTLTKNQIDTLKLYRKGVKKSEICNILKLNRNSVDEAIKRAQNNIQRAIRTIQLAAKDDLLISSEKAVLIELLSKL